MVSDLRDSVIKPHGQTVYRRCHLGEYLDGAVRTLNLYLKTVGPSEFCL
jgi:hypothetical protein